MQRFGRRMQRFVSANFSNHPFADHFGRFSIKDVRVPTGPSSIADRTQHERSRVEPCELKSDDIVILYCNSIPLVQPRHHHSTGIQIITSSAKTTRHHASGPCLLMPFNTKMLLGGLRCRWQGFRWGEQRRISGSVSAEVHLDVSQCDETVHERLIFENRGDAWLYDLLMAMASSDDILSLAEKAHP